jgi:hypothetical protein
MAIRACCLHVYAASVASGCWEMACLVREESDLAVMRCADPGGATGPAGGCSGHRVSSARWLRGQALPGTGPCVRVCTPL